MVLPSSISAMGSFLRLGNCYTGEGTYLIAIKVSTKFSWPIVIMLQVSAPLLILEMFSAKMQVKVTSNSYFLRFSVLDITLTFLVLMLLKNSYSLLSNSLRCRLTVLLAGRQCRPTLTVVEMTTVSDGRQCRSTKTTPVNHGQRY